MSNADQLELIVRVLYAMALGSLIGFQREYRGHEAGIRTMGLVAFGTAVFVESAKFSGELRIAAYTVQAVGVLGAGIIFQGSGGIKGITTAMTIWVVASVGMLAAFELPIAAGLAAVAVVVALELQPISDWVYAHRTNKGFRWSLAPPRTQEKRDQP